jgi:hypothetical protein
MAAFAFLQCVTTALPSLSPPIRHDHMTGANVPNDVDGSELLSVLSDRGRMSTPVYRGTEALLVAAFSKGLRRALRPNRVERVLMCVRSFPERRAEPRSSLTRIRRVPKTART